MNLLSICSHIWCGHIRGSPSQLLSRRRPASGREPTVFNSIMFSLIMFNHCGLKQCGRIRKAQCDSSSLCAVERNLMADTGHDAIHNVYCTSTRIPCAKLCFAGEFILPWNNSGRIYTEEAAGREISRARKLHDSHFRFSALYYFTFWSSLSQWVR